MPQSAASLARTLQRDRDLALLFRTLATLRTDLPLFENVDELAWSGPTPAFAELGARFDSAVTEKKKRDGGSQPVASNQ